MTVNPTTTTPLSLLILAFSLQVFASPSPSCNGGQELICVPNACSNSMIGCQENPPTPTCFCATPPSSNPSTRRTEAAAQAAHIECVVGPAADDSAYVILDLQHLTAVFKERYHEMGIPDTSSPRCQQDASGIRCTFVTTNSEVSENPEAFQVNIKNTGDAIHPVYSTATLSLDPWTERGPALTMSCKPLSP